MLSGMGGIMRLTFAMMNPTGLLTVGLMVYFLIHAVNSKTIDTGERVVWIILLVLFNSLVFPIYWAMRIRPRSAGPAGTSAYSPQFPGGSGHL